MQLQKTNVMVSDRLRLSFMVFPVLCRHQEVTIGSSLADFLRAVLEIL
jgi:hypothetical protein